MLLVQSKVRAGRAARLDAAGFRCVADVLCALPRDACAQSFRTSLESFAKKFERFKKEAVEAEMTVRVCVRARTPLSVTGVRWAAVWCRRASSVSTLRGRS